MTAPGNCRVRVWSPLRVCSPLLCVGPAGAQPLPVFAQLPPPPPPAGMAGLGPGLGAGLGGGAGLFLPGLTGVGGGPCPRPAADVFLNPLRAFWMAAFPSPPEGGVGGSRLYPANVRNYDP